MYVCMYASTQVHRRHHLQTGIGRELGEKFSQVKKQEMKGTEERRKRKEKCVVNKRYQIICRNKGKYANNHIECV